jgi:hypothetical protein
MDGTNQTLSLTGNNHDIQIVEAGKGLNLTIGSLMPGTTATDITIYGWQNTGHINFINQGLIAGIQLTSDHHGGTMLTVGSRISIDVVGDAMLTKAHITAANV